MSLSQSMSAKPGRSRRAADLLKPEERNVLMTDVTTPKAVKYTDMLGIWPGGCARANRHNRRQEGTRCWRL